MLIKTNSYNAIWFSYVESKKNTVFFHLGLAFRFLKNYLTTYFDMGVSTLVHNIKALD